MKIHRVFGQRVAGKSYYDRPGAYLICIRDGGLAVVQTPKGFFLPGGGKEEGETDKTCIEREVLEETGCTVDELMPVCSAEQFCLHETLGYFHPIQFYYSGALENEKSPAAHINHSLQWIRVERAEKEWYVPSQRWAVGLLRTE